MAYRVLFLIGHFSNGALLSVGNEDGVIAEAAISLSSFGIRVTVASQNEFRGFHSPAMF